MSQQNAKAAARRADEIRREALAHLATPQPTFKARARVIELGDLAETFPDLEKDLHFLQARILTILARGGRPRQAQKPLFRLFKASLECARPEVYQQFEQVLRYLFDGSDALEGLHFHRSFSELDHTKIWQDIGDGIEKLRNHGYEAFLNSGTLLGAYRDKKLISYDDDVDLGLCFTADSPEDAAEKWLELTAELAQAGLLSGEQTRNPATRKLKSAGPYNIDLFPAWNQEGRFYIYPYCCGDLPTESFLPTRTCETSGLPIPNKPAEVLQQNYGEGWEKPDPGFVFRWGRANRQFAAFRDRLEELAQV